MVHCPKCNADISDSYEEDDFSVGIVGGYYCNACDCAYGFGEVSGHEPRDGDVVIGPLHDRSKPLGTPLSKLSTRPGEEGYAEWIRISKSWGYD